MKRHAQSAKHWVNCKARRVQCVSRGFSTFGLWSLHGTICVRIFTYSPGMSG